MICRGCLLWEEVTMKGNDVESGKETGIEVVANSDVESGKELGLEVVANSDVESGKEIGIDVVADVDVGGGASFVVILISVLFTVLPIATLFIPSA